MISDAEKHIAMTLELQRLKAEVEGAAAIIAAERSEVLRLRAENKALHDALTPSFITKAAYSGEVVCSVPEGYVGHHVPWTSIKQIMRMIREQAVPTGQIGRGCGEMI